MRAALSVTAALIAFAFLAAATPVVLDRIAVSIELEVIPESEVIRQIRLTAFLNGEKPDFSGSSKRLAADRLVEQALIRHELQTSRYLTTAANANALYEQFRKAQYPDGNSYALALKNYGLTDVELRTSFEWQATLLEFIDVRFRPGVQITDEEVADYYNVQYLTDAKASGQTPQSLEDAHDSIEEILISQRVDNAVDRWLGRTRTQYQIRYRREVFE